MLQHLDSGNFDLAPKVDQYLRNLESRQSALPDDLRVAVPRVLRAMYTLRSRRGIVHKGSMDPHVYDLRFLYGSAQWVLSEIVSFVSSTGIGTANVLVQFIQLPADELVEDFGGRKLVLTNGTAGEELLLLLRHYYPETVTVTQIHKDMDRRKPSTVSGAFSSTRQKKLIEGDRERGVKLTRLGYDAANELVRTHMVRANNSKR